MERFVVPLVLIAVTVAADAAFAKGGPLLLFTSRASPPTISQPVSPSDFRGWGVTATWYAKVSRPRHSAWGIVRQG